MTLALGLDFGTESVRALLVDLAGHLAGTTEEPYAHGQLTATSPLAPALFGEPLPPTFALQHPDDWLAAAAVATHRALTAAPTGAAVCGIGVDFTSCTVVPALLDGSALATAGTVDASRPHAWPKLWKHHGAAEQAERLTALARERNEPWLSRYGGVVGLEWFFPKVLEVIDKAPDIADAVEVWVEAGDWLVWQLVGAPAAGGEVTADGLVRSTCQAGYKGLWSAQDGFPSRAYFEAADPRLAEQVDNKLPGRFAAPGQPAGSLCAEAAARFGLPVGIPVSAAVIDAHAGMPGAGIGGPGELVAVLGTSGCHMIMDPDEHRIAGVAGVVEDGILPGLFGYETGQAAVGDGFEWVRRLAGGVGHAALEADAAALSPGVEGLLVIDWFNGCRTPLMDGRVGGAILHAQLHHGPAHLYRSALEASAAGLRWVCDTLRDGGVAIDRVVAAGGLPHRNRLFIEIMASMLDTTVFVSHVEHGSAMGAAVLGAVAAERFSTAGDAVAAMAGPASAVPAPIAVEPDPRAAAVLDGVYHRYRRAAESVAALTSPEPRPQPPPESEPGGPK